MLLLLFLHFLFVFFLGFFFWVFFFLETFRWVVNGQISPLQVKNVRIQTQKQSDGLPPASSAAKSVLMTGLFETNDLIRSWLAVLIVPLFIAFRSHCLYLFDSFLFDLVKVDQPG